MKDYKYKVQQNVDGRWEEVFCAQTFDSAKHWKDGLEESHPSEKYRIIKLPR